MGVVLPGCRERTARTAYAVTMKLTSRAAVCAAFASAPLLLLAGCGGATATGARSTLGNIQPTSFVEVAPATTTTTTTTLAPVGAATPGQVAPGEQTYVVVAGDGLSKIASLHEITLDQLINYNGFSGPSQLIQPGDVIKIPPNAVIPGTATEAVVPDNAGDDASTGDGTEASGEQSTESGEGCTHTIVQDENPSKVANIYDITVDELRAANPGGVMDTFLIGATLNIPANGNCG